MIKDVFIFFVILIEVVFLNNLKKWLFIFLWLRIFELELIWLNNY